MGRVHDQRSGNAIGILCRDYLALESASNESDVGSYNLVKIGHVSSVLWFGKLTGAKSRCDKYAVFVP